MISFKMAICTIYILKRHYLSSQAVLFLFLLVCFTVKKCAAATTKATTTVPTDAPTTTTITPTTTKAPLNGHCSSIDICSTGICVNSICTCDNTQYNNSGTCENKIAFGSSCDGSYQCVNTTDCVGNEDSGVCGCNDTHFSKDNATCQEKLPFGTSCNKSDQCKNTTDCINQSGDSMVCGCSGDDFSYDNFTCLPKLSYGVQCNDTSQCKNTTECLGKMCGCNSNNYFNNSICLPKSDHQGPCSLNMTDVCSNNATKCISQSGNYYCLCDASSFWYNSSKTCLKTSELKVKIVKFSTTDHSVNIEWSPVQYGNVYYNITSSPQSSSLQNLTSNNITIANLTGGTSYTFTITTVLPGDQKFYQDRSDINTVSITTNQTQHGGMCKGSNQAECVSGTTCNLDKQSKLRCLCSSSQYRSTVETCLEINTINIPDAGRETNSFYFTWRTINENANNINYLISVDGEVPQAANTTNGSVKNLFPGKNYTIYFITEVQEDNYYSKKSLNSSNIFWTKPASPGEYTYKSSETPGSYNISFTKSEGVVAIYTLNLMNQNNIQMNNTAPFFTVQNLNPATTYSFEIIAYNGNNDPSEPRKGTLSTNATSSGKVFNLTIDNIGNTTAQAKWQEPKQTNGNITAYVAYLKKKSECVGAYKLCFNVCNRKVNLPGGCPGDWNSSTVTNQSSQDSQIELNLTNLNPYTEYVFNVYAINDGGEGEENSANFTTKVGDQTQHGGVCQGSNPAECVSGTTCIQVKQAQHQCLCNSSQYRSTVETCLEIKTIKPIDQRETHSFYFTWGTINEIANNINYLISVDGEVPQAANTTNEFVENLIPGKNYIIYFITEVQEDSYYLKKSFNSSYIFWTMPAKPGEVTYDMIAAPSLYNVSFNPSEGVVVKYAIEIMNGSNMLQNTSSSPFFIFEFKPRTSYTYILFAWNGNEDISENRTGIITTSAFCK